VVMPKSRAWINLKVLVPESYLDVRGKGGKGRVRESEFAGERESERQSESVTDRAVRIRDNESGGWVLWRRIGESES
jgi:hypothetical protein